MQFLQHRNDCHTMAAVWFVRDSLSESPTLFKTSSLMSQKPHFWAGSYNLKLLPRKFRKSTDCIRYHKTLWKCSYYHCREVKFQPCALRSLCRSSSSKQLDWEGTDDQVMDMSTKSVSNKCNYVLRFFVSNLFFISHNLMTSQSVVTGSKSCFLYIYLASSLGLKTFDYSIARF